MTGKSEIAEQALVLIQELYAIEAEIKKNTDGSAEQRCQYQQKYSQPVMQQLHEWLIQHQNAVTQVLQQPRRLITVSDAGRS